MRVLGVFLAALLLFSLSAARAQPTQNAGDPVQAMFDRVGKMTSAEQQAWLMRLEQRAARAARLTLKPDEAAQQQAKTFAQLHQKMVSWQVLREVVEDVDKREKDAIDRLVQRYRARVIDVFPNQVDIQGERQQAWGDVYKNWNAAGRRFERQDQLINWLEAAIRNTTPGSVASIPKKSVEAAKPQAAVKPKSPEPEEINPAKTIQPRAAEPPLPLPGPATTSLKPSPSVVRAAVTQPKAEQGHRPEPRASDHEALHLPRRESHAIGVLQPKVEEDALPKVAAIDLPTETRVPPPRVSREPATETPTAASDESPADSVEIKIDELTVRISGCNLAFRALESDMDEKGVWTAARIEPLLERLKILSIRRNDLNLFREAVPEAKRSSVERLISPKSVVSQLGARIFEARGLASGANFKGTDSERQIELQRLEELSRRLAELAGK